MINVPQTSLERPIIWFPGSLTTGSRRRPVDVSVLNICSSSVTQELLFLKRFFSFNHQFLYWYPESPLKVLSRAGTLGRFGDLQGTSPSRRVSDGYKLYFWLYFWFWQKNILSQSNRTRYKDKQNNLILKTWLIDPM